MIAPDRLSRFLSFLLRHRPPEFPLDFNRQGFVPWDELVATVGHRFPGVSEEEILGVINLSGRKRFELREGKVRATYGHSFPVDLGLQAVEPPDRLFHGTARDLAQTILREGLKPRGRQYVHLSGSLEEALEVGKRQDPNPSIIVVDSKAAYSTGIQFYFSGPVFLSEGIPQRFLSLSER